MESKLQERMGQSPKASAKGLSHRTFSAEEGKQAGPSTTPQRVNTDDTPASASDSLQKQGSSTHRKLGDFLQPPSSKTQQMTGNSKATERLQMQEGSSLLCNSVLKGEKNVTIKRPPEPSTA